MTRFQTIFIVILSTIGGAVVLVSAYLAILMGIGALASRLGDHGRHIVAQRQEAAAR